MIALFPSVLIYDGMCCIKSISAVPAALNTSYFTYAPNHMSSFTSITKPHVCTYCMTFSLIILVGSLLYVFSVIRILYVVS
jgi:hypothetical protein